MVWDMGRTPWASPAPYHGKPMDDLRGGPTDNAGNPCPKRPQVESQAKEMPRMVYWAMPNRKDSAHKAWAA